MEMLPWRGMLACLYVQCFESGWCWIKTLNKCAIYYYSVVCKSILCIVSVIFSLCECSVYVEYLCAQYWRAISFCLTGSRRLLSLCLTPWICVTLVFLVGLCFLMHHLPLFWIVLLCLCLCLCLAISAYRPLYPLVVSALCLGHIVWSFSHYFFNEFFSHHFSFSFPVLWTIQFSLFIDLWGAYLLIRFWK